VSSRPFSQEEMPVFNGFTHQNSTTSSYQALGGGEGPVNGSVDGEGSLNFNDLMKEEFNWLDQLRDSCLEEDSATASASSQDWNINILYGVDVPDDIRGQIG